MAPQTALVPAPNCVTCVTCKATLHVNEVFDAWEMGGDRDTCPRCQGLLLDVVTLP